MQAAYITKLPCAGTRQSGQSVFTLAHVT